MEEKTQLCVFDVGSVDFGTKQFRQEHEVVVVDPDHVVVGYDGGNFVGKEAVSLVVGHPGVFVKVDLARVVVEKRPENGVGEAVVVQSQRFRQRKMGMQLNLLIKSERTLCCSFSGISNPGQPNHWKLVDFLRPWSAVTKPPEDMEYW